MPHNLSEPEADRQLEAGAEPDMECAICGDAFYARQLDAFGICRECRDEDELAAERAAEQHEALIDWREGR